MSNVTIVSALARVSLKPLFNYGNKTRIVSNEKAWIAPKKRGLTGDSGATGGSLPVELGRSGGSYIAGGSSSSSREFDPR